MNERQPNDRHLLKRILSICDEVKMEHFPVKDKMCGKKCRRIKEKIILCDRVDVQVQHEP